MARRPFKIDPPLTHADLDALRHDANKHGRNWKTELGVEWINASAGPILHTLLNTDGPT